MGGGAEGGVATFLLLYRLHLLCVCLCVCVCVGGGRGELKFPLLHFDYSVF